MATTATATPRNNVRNFDATGLASVERQATERSTAMRNRAAAAAKGDLDAISRLTAETLLCDENIERLEDKLRPKQQREGVLCQQINQDAEKRARFRLQEAAGRAEKEVLDLGRRVNDARAVLADLEQKFQSAQMRLTILRSRDRAPGAAAGDVNEILRRAAEYGAVMNVKDERQELKLSDGRVGRFCGFVGAERRIVLDLGPGTERITVARTELADPASI